MNTWNNSMRFPVHSELKEIREEGGSMDSKAEIKMSISQLELLLEYLPDGVVLEISWEDTHEE